MKILYFYPEKSGPMFYWQRVHFIDELIRSGVSIEIFNPLLCNSPEEANSALLHKLNGECYDLCFTNVCSELLLYKETIIRIREMGIPICCLRCDNLVIPYADKNLAPLFDLVWLTSKETQYLYNKWNVKSIFLPYAANPYTFIKGDTIRNNKVCFVGTLYGSRPSLINSLVDNNICVDVFNKPNIQVQNCIPISYSINNQTKSQMLINRLFLPQGRHLLKGKVKCLINKGNQIHNNQFISFYPKVPVQDLCNVYSAYDLALASTSAGNTDVLKRPLKIINLRNFEIPMSGGVEICKYNSELAEYFEENKEIIFYRSIEELLDKANYYTRTATDKEINNIKQAARSRAERDHSWMSRFRIIFDVLGLKN